MPLEMGRMVYAGRVLLDVLCSAPMTNDDTFINNQDFARTYFSIYILFEAALVINAIIDKRNM